MALAATDITFSYREKPVLTALSLTISPGRFYGIIGPNGCGKSTLLDLLVKLRNPASGDIVYKKKPLAGYSKRKLSREMALVPQDFNIRFPFTAREIVMMGRYPHMSRFSRPSPDDMGIVDTVMKRTETLEFRNRFIAELSGGERQRVVVARAFAQNTPFLFLDEATSNLDINHALGILKIAREGIDREQKTVVAVMQDINLAALFCDELVFMKQGQIVSSGSVTDTLTPDTLQTVFGVDAKVRFESHADTRHVVFRR
jgi:iron complex transport system ATP-binding protein